MRSGLNKILISHTPRRSAGRRHVFVLHPLVVALCLVGPGSREALARDYFDAAFLGGNVDLSAYETAGATPEGDYLVDIWMNQQQVSTRQVRFVKDSKGEVVPELTPDDLRKMGVAVDRLPALKGLPKDKPVGDIRALIPASTFTLTLSSLRLDITVPQVDMDESVAGGVDPSLWDEGVPALMFGYNLSGSKNWMDGYSGGSKSTSRSLFGNVNGRANLGAWRLYSTMTMSRNEQSGDGYHSSDSQSRFNNTYLQRDVQRLRGQLTMGESSTGSSVFDSIPFRGVMLTSSDEMLPTSQRGFAPVISGTAKSNARVTVTQNGSTIYETNVPPGPFRLTDIYNGGNGGEMVVTVTEADGSKHVSTQAYSSLPVMKRPGGVDYEVAVARYHNGGYTRDSQDPLFALATTAVGLTGNLTLYGGLLAAKDYQSLVTGVGMSLGLLGAVSLDSTLTRARFDRDQTGGSGREGETDNGAAFRARYSKSMMSTGTTVDISAYRYATRNFYSFQDAMSRGYTLREGYAPWMMERRRSSWQMNVSQTLGSLGSVFLRGSRDDYWNSDRVVNNLSAGFSSSVKGVGYSVNYDIDHTTGGRRRGEGNDWSTNRQISLSLSIPFSIFGPKMPAMQDISSNYSMTHDNHGRTSQQAGLGGSFLDNRLSWNVAQSHDNQGGGSSGNAGLSYSGSKGNVGLNYGYGQNNRSVSGNASGALVLHQHGVSLASSLGDSMALIEAPGADGVKVLSGNTETNQWGYAVAPYLQNYQRNTISLDPTTLPDGVDVSNSSVTVYPTRGALVEAKFRTRVGRQAMLTLNFQGKPVPFGAMASLPDDDALNSTIVGDGGMVYLTGAPQSGRLKVSWGSGPDQQCEVHYDLGELPKVDPKDKDAPSVNIVQQTLTCQPVAGSAHPSTLAEREPDPVPAGPDDAVSQPERTRHDAVRHKAPDTKQ